MKNWLHRAALLLAFGVLLGIPALAAEPDFAGQTPEEIPAAFVSEAPAVVEEPEAEPQSAFEWWMVAVALGVFLAGGGVVALVFNTSRIQGKYEKRWNDRMGEK